MKHIIRFLRLIKVGLVILCTLIISSAIFPGVFSWSTEEGKAQIQDFVDNVRNSTDKILTDISEKTGWFQNSEKENSASSNITGRADYKAPEDIGKEISGPVENGQIANGNEEIQAENKTENNQNIESEKNSRDRQIAEDGEDVKISADYNITDERAVFDTLYYPYFGILTADEQVLYEQLYENMLKYNTDIDLKITTSAEALAKVFEAVYNDHPEIFWLDTSYQYGYYSSGKVAKVILSFNETADDIEQAKAQFDKAAEKIVQGAQAFNNAFDKELYVHDALNELAEYNENAPLNQSAYSALVGGSSVCAGYSKAFQYLMQQIGIPCYYCVGYANGEHAWNIVYIDGVYYNVDVSWNDGAANPYEYFNMPYEEFRLTHSISGLSKSVFGG